MPLFDTHAHYNDDAFDQNRKGLLDALPDAGVGAVVIPALAILPAWLSYGPESGILTLALAIIMFSRHYHGLMRIRQGTEPRFFQRRNPK